jgi:hypothetical protein
MTTVTPKQITSYGQSVLVAALTFRNGELDNQISYLHVLQ